MNPEQQFSPVETKNMMSGAWEKTKEKTKKYAAPFLIAYKFMLLPLSASGENIAQPVYDKHTEPTPAVAKTVESADRAQKATLGVEEFMQYSEKRRRMMEDQVNKAEQAPTAPKAEAVPEAEPAR